jgi:xylulokinase
MTFDGALAASATSPAKEMDIISLNHGWAEQQPELWWTNVKAATAEVLRVSGAAASDIKAIGISYQMHGLVAVDKNQQVLRPSIIWCDSRSVAIGDAAAKALGSDLCLANSLNLPGNFTASKLKWVKDNEPEIFDKIDKVMLPGDYIAMKMTGDITTTASGLSEMILWNFKDDKPADFLMDHYGFSRKMFADIVPGFGQQSIISKQAAEEIGLAPGTPITYRAGDQPNNALSLNVLQPGQIATTAGTSGVVYGVTDKANYDPESRVNTFVHVNHSAEAQRYGVLLCINGTGILNSWLKHNVATAMSYEQMNAAAANIAIGSDGLKILPYGNGAERTLVNKDINANISGLNFNLHSQSHLIRAAQEGIVFAMNYGLDIMTDLGVEINTVRAGSANMFLSPVFAQTFASTASAIVELYNTDGAQGAARAAGIGAGIYKDETEAFAGLKCVKTIEPENDKRQQYKDAYGDWLEILTKQLS